MIKNMQQVVINFLDSKREQESKSVTLGLYNGTKLTSTYFFEDLTQLSLEVSWWRDTMYIYLAHSVVNIYPYPQRFILLDEYIEGYTEESFVSLLDQAVLKMAAVIDWYESKTESQTIGDYDASA